MSRLNQKISLCDGRILGFDELGPRDGFPIFYFHGTPSARIEFNAFGDETLVNSLNIRLIAPDRPGCGISDFQPARRFLDWPKDIALLADHLKIDRFAILGYSGGGPYAASCAYSIPERTTKIGIVSGTGPFDQAGLADHINVNSRRFMDLAHKKPRLHRLILRSMGFMSRFAPGKVIENALAALPEPDQKTISLPDVQQGFLAMIQESLRHGPCGAQLDTYLMVDHWDFRPQDIQCPVYLWHGGKDQNAPIAMARYMAHAIPNSQLHIFEDEGHLSLLKKKIRNILTFLSQPKEMRS
jgi:pimeloyl-ACP methyl ester carboxylesterase